MDNTAEPGKANATGKPTPRAKAMIKINNNKKNSSKFKS